MNFVEEPIITYRDLDKAKSIGKKIVVSYEDEKKYKNKKPNFTAMGNPMKATHILANLTKPEAFAFTTLEEHRDYVSNTVEFGISWITPTKQTVFKKGFKGLQSKGLIKRIKRGRPSTYIFNPDFIVPLDYDEALEKWNNTK